MSLIEKELINLRRERDELARQNAKLAARLAEIEAQKPVGVVEAGEWRTGFGDTSPAVWVKITQDGAGVSVPLGTVLHARPVPAAAPERAEPIGYLSPGQLYLIRDGEGEGGRYMPVRKTPRGLFTLPIYAGEPVQTKLCRCGPDGCSDSTSCPRGER